jgi:hypothetical protein
LAKKWKQSDWLKGQKELNEYTRSHIDIGIDGFGNLDIHLLYQISDVKRAIPLLFVHGCKYRVLEADSEALLSPLDRCNSSGHFWDPYRAGFTHRSTGDSPITHSIG